MTSTSDTTNQSAPTPSENDELEAEEEITFVDIDLDDNAIGLPRHFRCACHTLSLLATTDFQNFVKANKDLKSIHAKTLSKCFEL